MSLSLSSSTLNLSNECYSSVYLSSELELAEISTEKLKQVVAELASSNLKIKHENEVYESYLRRTEPKIVLDLEEDVKRLASSERRLKRRLSFNQCMMQSRVDLDSKWTYKPDETTRSPVASIRPTTTSSATTLTTGARTIYSTIPQINIRLKFELMDREVELKRIGFEEFRRDALMKLIMLQETIENHDMSLDGTRNTQEAFVNNVVATAVGNITGRVTAEKFVGFMENHLKKSGIELCLLNLEIGNKRATYRTLKRTLTQRAELAENKGILDLIILQREVQSRCDELLEKVAGADKLKAAVPPIEKNMSRQKDNMTKLMSQLEGIKDLIKKKEILMQYFDSDMSRTRIEIVTASKQLNALREYRSQFVPIDEMGYLHVKLEIVRLKKDIKNWLRRRKVQRANIDFSIRHMKVNSYSVMHSALLTTSSCFKSLILITRSKQQ